MKSKNFTFLTFIVLMIIIYPIFPIVIPNNNGNLNVGMENNVGTIQDDIKTADVVFDEQFDMAESIALWLRNEWMNNNLNRSNVIRLGEDGIASVGQFFIELYKVTSNTTYIDWAKDIADWMIAQHTSLGYPAGKWPNKIASTIISNYTGYEQGCAGIGSFFINLYNVSTSYSYLLNEARKIYTYLNNKAQATPTGLSWEEKEPIIYSNEVGYVSYNTTRNGTVSAGSLSNVNTYDGSTYDIQAVNSHSEVNYVFLLDQLIPTEDSAFLDSFLTELTVSISVRSSTALTTGDVLIYNSGNSSWVDITGASTIGMTENTFTKIITSGFSNWTQKLGDIELISVKVNTTDGVSHIVYVDALNITIDYDNSYNSVSYATGAAGIGSFYLDMCNSDWGNQTLINQAKDAADYILEEAKEYNQNSAWLEKNKYYTGIQKGAAGIGKYLLRLKKITGNTTFLTYAEKAANWLINSNATISTGLILEGPSLFWGEYNKSSNILSDILPGMDYCAGIGQFLLELGQDIGGTNDYKINATYAANWLINANFNHMAETEKFFDRIAFYKWKSKLTSRYSYAESTAGVLEFLDNIFMETLASNYTNALSKGMEWIFKTIDIQAGIWGGTFDAYAIPNGLAGVGYAFTTINLKKPSIQSILTPISYEFNDTLRVIFNIQGFGSNITDFSTELRFEYDANADFDNLTNMGGNNFYYDFVDISYNKTVNYAIFVVDSNGTFSLDNNGSVYLMNVVDSHAPITRLVPLYGEGISAGAYGILEIRVKKNEDRGSPLTHIIVNSPILGINDQINWTASSSQWTTEGDEYVHSYQISVGAGFVYNTLITVNVSIYDAIGNQRYILESFIVTDTIPPIFTETSTIGIRWIPQFTSYDVEAKVGDVGSGISDTQGVFVKYTTDEGRTWQIAYLQKVGTKYEGAIPGQFWFVTVYFVFGAVDLAGNEIYEDVFKTTYTNVEDIPLYAMHNYQVILNWFVLLAIVGVIALISVLSYLVYSRRGGYLEKMRRKSKAAATGLAIKERLTNFYYNLVEKLNRFGEKLTKGLSGGGGKIKLWFEEHLSEKTKKLFQKIGRVLIAVPKGIVNGIRAFFVGIGRLITRTKGVYIVFYMGLGFIIVVTTVVQFFMEAGYPIRAVFFANLGFMMFLSGLIGFLIRFIYKLAYK